MIFEMSTNNYSKRCSVDFMDNHVKLKKIGDTKHCDEKNFIDNGGFVARIPQSQLG